MGTITSRVDDEYLEAEIESLSAWYKDLVRYLTEGLDSASVTKEDFSLVAATATRVVMRLKVLHDHLRDGDHEIDAFEI